MRGIVLLFILIAFIPTYTATAMDYVINGTGVYIDDANVYLDAIPHTRTDDGYVYFNLISKKYTGNIDVLLGVDTERARATQAELFTVDGWNDISGKFETYNIDYDGKNKWYMLDNINVIENRLYILRVWFDLDGCWINDRLEGRCNKWGKYDFAIKPSALTFQEAKQQGKLYVLDPWWDASWDYKQVINITVSSGTTDQGQQVYFNINNTVNGTDWNWSNECVDGHDSRMRIVNGSEDTLVDYYVESCSITDKNMSLWLESDQNLSTTLQSFYIYYNNEGGATDSDWNETLQLFDDANHQLNDTYWSLGGSGTFNVTYDSTYKAYKMDISTNSWVTLQGTNKLGMYSVKVDKYHTTASGGRFHAMGIFKGGYASGMGKCGYYLKFDTKNGDLDLIKVDCNATETVLTTDESFTHTESLWNEVELYVTKAGKVAVNYNGAEVLSATDTAYPMNSSSWAFLRSDYGASAGDIVYYRNITGSLKHDYDSSVVFGTQQSKTASGITTVDITYPTNTSYAYTSNIDLEFMFSSPYSCNTSLYSLNGGSNVSTGCANTTITPLFGTNNLTLWANNTNGTMAFDSVFWTMQNGIVNCSDPNANESLNFSFYDELGLNAITADAEYTITVLDLNWSTSGSVTDSYNFSLCITGDSYLVDMTLEYSEDDYGTRFYLFDNATITNVTQDIQLYLLNESVGEDISVTVLDAVGWPYDGVYVQFMRWYLDENQYRVVAMMKSDDNGLGTVFLEQANVYYKIALTEGGTRVRLIAPEKLPSNEITIYSSIGQILTYYNYSTGMGYDCSYSDVTKYLTCSVTDSSGMANEVCLDVNTWGIINLTDYASDCQSGASMTFLINMTNATSINKTASYILYALDDENNKIVLLTGSEEFSTGTVFGIFGIMLMMLVFATMVLVGVWDPAISVIFGVVGIVAMIGLGILEAPYLAMGSLLTSAILVIYLITKWRRE